MSWPASGGALGSDARDGVRLMVARRSTRARRPPRFADMGGALAPGDVLVVNTSAVIPAALDARGPGGGPVRLHLSTEQPGGFWVAEPRRRPVRAPTRTGGARPATWCWRVAAGPSCWPPTPPGPGAPGCG